MLLNELGIDQSRPTELWCDNQGSIALSCNPTHHKLTKHIDVRYHRIRDEIADGTLSIHYVQSADNPADIMTKPLSELKHQRAVQFLQMTGKL